MKHNGKPAILVVDDVEEVRDVLQRLLEADGYCVEAARSDEQAIECAIRRPPQVILVNLGGSLEDVIAAARRISHNAGLKDRVPMVLFCIEGIEELEVNLGGNLYSMRPDNFNDLREFVRRLLSSLVAR